MTRIYAGILGLLAFLTCVVRGLMHGESPMSILSAACGSLLVFAIVGSIVGWLAAQTVEEAVRGRLQAELAEETPPQSASTARPTTS